MPQYGSLAAVTRAWFRTLSTVLENSGQHERNVTMKFARLSLFSPPPFRIFRERESLGPRLQAKMASSTVGSGRKDRLTVDNVYDVLKQANPDWKWVAKSILEISVNKCDEIGERYSTDEERLKQAIDFWLKRCTFASWRTLLYQFYRFKLDAQANVIQGYAEPILDDNLTRENINAALAEMSDDELGSFLVRHEGKRAELRRGTSTSEEYRIRLINHWLETFHTPTWEYLAGRCFLSKKREIHRKISEHFQRKLESSLTHDNLTDVQSKVKDWDIAGLPMQLGIQNELTKELEETYPDPTQRTEAFIKMFLEDYPAPSWELVCRALYIKEEYEVLEFVQNKYYQGTSETRRHLRAAMKKGKGKISITKVVLFGLPETGKTCTKHVILDEEPPQEYNSTPLALRPVTIYCFDITPYQWKMISRKERDAIVARACQGFKDHRPTVRLPSDVMPPERMEEGGPSTKPDVAPIRTPVARPADQGATEQPEIAPMADVERATLRVDASKPAVNASTLSLGTYDGLVTAILPYLDKNEEVKIKRVQISDCGGQPQFHEILPIFIGGTTLYLYVLKLNEALSYRPMIKYGVDGESIYDNQRSTETYEQILEHCLRVVRSQKAKGEKLPQIMIIGTHKDLEHDCIEDRASKNKQLAQLLLPEFKTEVKYYRHCPKEVIFPLNARNPDEKEKEIAAQIRKLVEDECEADAVDIPLAWLALELVLEDLITEHGRDVISKKELFAAAQSQNLQIEDDDALDAALRFLHDHNVVFYYPDILPELVFANAQVLLNKVTELVRVAYKLRSGMLAPCVSHGELWQKFCDYALVSEVFLAQREFQDHYVPDLFNHKHLMKLFSKLLIFAPFSKAEFFVPAILKKLTEEELSKYRPSPDNSSLVLTFPNHGGPLLGVFCATVGALLSEDNVQPCQWKLEVEEDQLTPSCLKRNCVQFSIVGQPGVVTIIDSFKHLEVHLSADNPNDLPSGYCITIRRSFVQALRTATEALKYAYHEPGLGLGCPCGNTPFHVASISKDKNLWLCSKSNKTSGRLNKSQSRWLENLETGVEILRPIDQTPMLHELDRMERGSKVVQVIQIAAPVLERVALRLHFPRETIELLKKDHHQQGYEASHSMFTKWLNGEGRKPVTWKTLITALKEAGLAQPARDLESIIAV